MADHPDPTRSTGGSSADDTTTDEILAVIAVEEPNGTTADQVARAIGLGLNGEVVQRVSTSPARWRACCPGRRTARSRSSTSITSWCSPRC